MNIDLSVAYTRRRFANASLSIAPFPHLVVNDVFDEHTYAALLRNLPSVDQVLRCRNPDSGISQSRSIIEVSSLNSPFWNRFAMHFGGSEFTDCVMRRFVNRFDENSYVTTQIVQDRLGYSIGPHTDISSKIMTILFYLPPDDSLQKFGTSICTTTNPSLIGTENHHSWDHFEESHVVLFRPNSALAFCRTEASFHAVRAVDQDVIRNTVTITVRRS